MVDFCKYTYTFSFRNKILSTQYFFLYVFYLHIRFHFMISSWVSIDGSSLWQLQMQQCADISKFLLTAFFLEQLWCLLRQLLREMVFFKIEKKSLRKSCKGLSFYNICRIEACNFFKNELFPGAHLGGGSRGSRPLPFFDTVQIVPSNSETNLQETF